MKAKYIGDPSEGAKPDVPETFEAFGVTFERGKFATVSDAVGAKLAGNSHFQVQGETAA